MMWFRIAWLCRLYNILIFMAIMIIHFLYQIDMIT